MSVASESCMMTIVARNVSSILIKNILFSFDSVCVYTRLHTTSFILFTIILFTRHLTPAYIVLHLFLLRKIITSLYRTAIILFPCFFTSVYIVLRLFWLNVHLHKSICNCFKFVSIYLNSILYSNTFWLFVSLHKAIFLLNV